MRSIDVDWIRIDQIRIDRTDLRMDRTDIASLDRIRDWIGTDLPGMGSAPQPDEIDQIAI